VIPAQFDYVLAETPEHAVSMLDPNGDSKLLAGGHSLTPLMKLRFAQPRMLIDIGRLDELRYVRDEGGRIAIGALTTHGEVQSAALLLERCPLVAETAGMVGDPQVRHRGTIGGSVAHGDPASDLPTVLLALDATFKVLGPSGRREVPAREFFRGFMETAMEPNEMLVEITVEPEPESSKACYLKFNRRALDWATVGVALVARQEGDRRSVAIGLTNMGTRPLRATAVEERIADAGNDPSEIEAAADLAAEDTSPPSDTNGSAEYRQHLARVLTRRAIRQTIGSPG
jgi:aerobic carbon-monoxide dehydrogenase medium subunit